jgi:hypothetical protein
MAVLLSVADAVHAQSCAGGGRPWVALSYEGADWPRALRENAAADLRAGLRLRGIDVCAPDASTNSKPVARVELRMSGTERVLVSIDVYDAITNKRVLRDVDLHRATPDARGLLLAQAADELLRASWVELTLHDAPEPATAPPPAIVEVIQSEPLAARPATIVGARGAFEYHTGGETWLGADAIVELWLSRRLGASIAAGLRSGLPADAPHGRIESSAIVASADLLTPLWSAASRYNVCVMLGMQAADLALSGRASSPAHGYSRRGVALSARAGVLASFRPSPRLRVAVEVGPGLPLRAVAAYDTGQRVSSTSGLQLRATLGLGGVF